MNNQVENQENQVAKRMRVYRKKSTFKGATEHDFWYSATRSDGNSVVCVFKCDIPTESTAFEIGYVVGGSKKEEVTVNGKQYINYTYYITSCEFYEIEGEELEL